jgi:hypothetical protein
MPVIEMPIALTVLLQYFLLKNERGKLMGRNAIGKNAISR